MWTRHVAATKLARTILGGDIIYTMFLKAYWHVGRCYTALYWWVALFLIKPRLLFLGNISSAWSSVPSEVHLCKGIVTFTEREVALLSCAILYMFIRVISYFTLLMMIVGATRWLYTRNLSRSWHSKWCHSYQHPINQLFVEHNLSLFFRWSSRRKSSLGVPSWPWKWDWIWRCYSLRSLVPRNRPMPRSLPYSCLYRRESI